MHRWSEQDHWTAWELQCEGVSEGYAGKFEIVDIAREWVQGNGGGQVSGQ